MKLKSINKLTAGDTFHTGVTSQNSFVVLDIVERDRDYNVLVVPDGASFTGWQSYPKNTVFRMSAW